MLACEQEELLWFPEKSEEEHALLEVLQAAHNLVFGEDSSTEINFDEIAVKFLPRKEDAPEGVCGDCIQWSWS